MSQLDYGIIGNCQISALVDTRGKVAWCCMPTFEAPSIFASILDEEKGGFWCIEPAFGNWRTRQAYVRNTNVLVTTFIGETGGETGGDTGEEFEIADFMPRFDRSYGHYRPSQIVRILRPLKGVPRIVVRCRPRFGYGKETPRIVNMSSKILYEGREASVFLSADAPVSYILNEVPFELKEAKHFVLSYGVPFDAPVKFEAQELQDRTIAYWRNWAKHCNIPFEFQDQVLRSALALKLHIFEDTGAIIAATTTSIPEGPEPGRTWDYRYCWLRDAYFVVTALNKLGQFEEMESFIRYLQNIAAMEASRALQPVYGIGGEKELIERELPWLSGFKGYGPVHVGNAAYKTDQHDVYGEMVLAISPAFFDRRLDRTDLPQAFSNIKQLVEQAIFMFDQPDAGIWEFRGEKRHSVFSKIMNWAAVDRGIRIAAQMGRRELSEAWSPIREKMHQEVERNAWNEIVGYYTQSFGGDSPDAANLLLPSLNFLSHRHERFYRTLDFYEKNLRVKSGVYRYRTPDDIGVPKTVFTVCAFWMADALWGAGRKAEARELFLSVLAKTNHLGLLSEDMDPESGELWGNFPQTYSHVGLINTAMRISRPWEGEGEGEGEGKENVAA